MAIGLMAAYIPMIFPPSGSQNLPPEDGTPAAEDNYAAQLPDDPAPVATTTTSTAPAKASLPDSFSGLQDEQKSLDDLNGLLNK